MRHGAELYTITAIREITIGYFCKDRRKSLKLFFVNVTRPFLIRFDKCKQKATKRVGR